MMQLMRVLKNALNMKLSCFRVGKKRRIFLIPVLVLTAIYLVSVNNYEQNHGSSSRSLDVSRNYFHSAIQLSNAKFLVKNDKCQIPDINPWSREILEQILLEPTMSNKCNEINLTYVENGNVVINVTKIPELGYNMDDVLCCYRVVHRIEQTEHNFDKNADNLYRFSKKCYPMEPETRPLHGFIQVVCSVKYLFMDYVVYEDFHLIAVFPEEDKALQRKLYYWKNCSHSDETVSSNCPRGSLPNVLLIGIDSTSRLNFHRFMNKSRRVLENEIQAIEMNGYTKVGENTFPNFLPLLSSFSEEELSTFCYSQWKPQDNCPYIWKKFSDLNYVTAHLEDCPQFTIFNFKKTGFVRKPVDMYIRPWMHAAYKDKENAICIGNLRPDEIVLKYATDLVALSEFHKIPYFITSWITQLTHNDLNSIQHMDSQLENTLRYLHINGYLNNTLLLVMSDHGLRYGDVRLTTSGWFEDKLPFMYIKFPDALKKEYPRWVEVLKHNSKQLFTVFDVHATLQEILNLASLLPGINIPSTMETFSHNLTIPPLRGLSLFQFLPPRTCEEAGVPKAYCPCSPVSPFTGNFSLIEHGAQEILNSINARLPLVCSPLKVDGISASAVFANHQDDLKNSSSVDYVISLEAQPGKFTYEAVVTYNQAGGYFSNVTNILRTNKKSRKTPCLSDKDSAVELFCYCK